MLCSPCFFGFRVENLAVYESFDFGDKLLHNQILLNNKSSYRELSTNEYAFPSLNLILVLLFFRSLLELHLLTKIVWLIISLLLEVLIQLFVAGAFTIHIEVFSKCRIFSESQLFELFVGIVKEYQAKSIVNKANHCDPKSYL